jgi:hypothetical protein
MLRRMYEPDGFVRGVHGEDPGNAAVRGGHEESVIGTEANVPEPGPVREYPCANTCVVRPESASCRTAVRFVETASRSPLWLNTKALAGPYVIQDGSIPVSLHTRILSSVRSPEVRFGAGIVAMLRTGAL